jgi:hypothetical protein
MSKNLDFIRPGHLCVKHSQISKQICLFCKCYENQIRIFFIKLNSKLHLLGQRDFYSNGDLKEDHGLQLSSILELVGAQIDHFLSNCL